MKWIFILSPIGSVLNAIIVITLVTLIIAFIAHYAWEVDEDVKDPNIKKVKEKIFMYIKIFSILLLLSIPFSKGKEIYKNYCVYSALESKTLDKTLNTFENLRIAVKQKYIKR